MKVALLDDGVDLDIFDLYKNVTDMYDITESGNVLRNTLTQKCGISHGGICAKILSLYYPDIEIVSIRILNENGTGNLKQLVEGIRLCRRLKLKLINLSLGSTVYKDFETISNEVYKAVEEGCLFVAATNNKNIYTVPACLPMVFGVKAHTDNSNTDICRETGADGVSFTAPGIHTFQLAGGIPFTCQHANSFAAPVLTAQISKLPELETQIFTQVKRRLPSLSKNILYGRDIFDQPIYQAFMFDTKLYKQHIYINYDEDKSQSSARRNIMILTHKRNEIESLNPYLESNVMAIEHMIIAADIPASTYRILGRNKNIRIWTESYYVNAVQTFTVLKAIDETPVICITGDADDAIEFVQSAVKFVNENGFNSIGVSNFEYSYIYGLQYIPAEMEPFRFYQYVKGYYDCDIIFAFITGEADIKKQKDISDYYVSCGERCFSEAAEEWGGKPVLHYAKEEKQDMNKLVNTIINYFDR